MKKTRNKPEVQNWYKDRYQHVLVQRKLLALITLGSLFCTLVMAIAITQLVPLKSIEPYVIQVDPKSGITQAVDPAQVRELTANEAVNNYFIVQYIRAREGYNSADVLHQYNIVRLMSEDRKVYNRFVSEASPNNPTSNVARLGTLGTRVVKFQSIIYTSPNVAQVRLLISERGDKIPLTELHRVALVGFEYVKMNLSTEDRYLNPLGFRVTEYQISEDLLQQ